MIELYHLANAICAAKVRIALEEKGLDWTSIPVSDLRDEAYLAINPFGVVPTLVHNGVVFLESRIICEYLDEAFRAAPLVPATPLGRHRMRLWSKQIDDGLHLALYILGFSASGFGGAAMDDPATRALRLPREPFKRQVALELLRDGWSSPWIPVALDRARATVQAIELSLAVDPWLAGADYSLADADFTPCIQRLEDLGLNSLWARAPALTGWWARLKARPSYEAAVTRWRTPADDARFAQGATRLAALLPDVL